MRKTIKSTISGVHARSAGRHPMESAQRQSPYAARQLDVFVPIETLAVTQGSSTAMRTHCLTKAPTAITIDKKTAQRLERGRFGGWYYGLDAIVVSIGQPYFGSGLVALLQKHPKLLAPFGITLQNGILRFPDAIELNGILDWHGRRGPNIRFVSWPGMEEISWKAYAACGRLQRLPMAQDGAEFFHDRGAHYKTLYLPQRAYDLIMRRLNILYWAQCISPSTIDWGDEIHNVAGKLDGITAGGHIALAAYITRRKCGASADEAYQQIVRRDLLFDLGSIYSALLASAACHRPQETILARHVGPLAPIDHCILNMLDATFVSADDITQLEQTYLENAYRYSLLPVP
jgi:hypothetical protein